MKNLYIALGAIGLAICIFFYGNHVGKVEKQVEVDKANKKYTDLKEEHQGKIDEITQTLTEKIDTVTRDRDSALASLRNRAKRSAQQASQANCKGATGASLSSEDSDFLIREAARADRNREALTACYNYADTLQN